MYFVTKKGQMARSVYVADTDTNREERFLLEEAIFLAVFGIKIAGIARTSTGHWSVNQTAPPTASSARTIIAQGYSHAIVKNELKVVKYERGEGPFRVVVGDLATSVGASAFDYAICKKGITIILDDRVKKIHNDWLSEAIGMPPVKVDISAVTTDAMRTKVYASTPLSFIVDTHPDALKYEREVIVKRGEVRDSQLLADPEIHDFFLQRNRSQLEADLAGMDLTQGEFKSSHNFTAIKWYSFEEYVDHLGKGNPKIDQFSLNAAQKMRHFVRLPDKRLMGYFIGGGTDKDILSEYHRYLTLLIKDVRLALEIGELELDMTRSMPYKQYIDMCKSIQTDLGRGISVFQIQLKYNLKPLSKRNDMRR